MTASEEDAVKQSRVVEARARNISHNVRCTECGNPSIEDSQADVAILLRKVFQFPFILFVVYVYPKCMTRLDELTGIPLLEVDGQHQQWVREGGQRGATVTSKFIKEISNFTVVLATNITKLYRFSAPRLKLILHFVNYKFCILYGHLSPKCSVPSLVVCTSVESW